MPTLAWHWMVMPTGCRLMIPRAPVQRRRTPVCDGGCSSGRGEAVPGVVGTLATNMGVEMALKTRGIELVRAKGGRSLCSKELEKRQWLLGGEGSGHLLVLDKHTTGDGLVSALQVMQALQRSNKTLAQLLESVQLFPADAHQRAAWPHVGTGLENQPARGRGNTRRRAELGESGRVLIRASGTEPLVRVMVEARDAALAQSSAERIANAFGA